MQKKIKFEDLAKFALTPSQLKQLKGGTGSDTTSSNTSQIIIEDEILA